MCESINNDVFNTSKSYGDAFQNRFHKFSFLVNTYASTCVEVLKKTNYFLKLCFPSTPLIYFFSFLVYEAKYSYLKMESKILEVNELWGNVRKLILFLLLIFYQLQKLFSKRFRKLYGNNLFWFGFLGFGFLGFGFVCFTGYQPH